MKTNMRRLTIIAALALGLASLTGCDKYDDTALVKRIFEVEKEVTSLKDAVSKLQKAADENDCVTDVVDNGDGSYTITFAKSGQITFNCGSGTQGPKGDQGERGPQGEQGEKGEDGDSFFESVSVSDGFVTFVMSDGTTFSLPYAAGSFIDDLKSLTYVPSFSDGAVEVGTALESTVTFIVSPSSLASKVANADKTLKMVWTGTRAGLDASTVEISKTGYDTSDGTVTLSFTASESVFEDYFRGTKDGMLLLQVSDGEDSVSSELVPVCCTANIAYTGYQINAALKKRSVASTATYNTEDYNVKKIVFRTGSLGKGDTALETTGGAYVWCSYDGGVVTISTPARSIRFVKSDGTTNLFSQFRALESIDGLENLDFSVVTSFMNTFYKCDKLRSIDLSSVNTGKVTSVNDMFGYCYSLGNIMLGSGFDTSECTSFSYMFEHCEALTSIDLSSLDVSTAEKLSFMFLGCSALEYVNTKGWNTVSVMNMQSMFSQCSALQDLDLTSFNTLNVTNMSQMFYGCTAMSDLNLGKDFVVDNVLSSSSMIASMASKSKAVTITCVPAVKAFLSGMLSSSVTYTWINVNTGEMM